MTTTHNAEELWTSAEVAREVGATYRQLDHWCRNGLIPGQDEGRGVGSGHRRKWTDKQVEIARRLAFVAWLRNRSIGDMARVLDNVPAFRNAMAETKHERTEIDPPKNHEQKYIDPNQLKLWDASF